MLPPLGDDPGPRQDSASPVRGIGRRRALVTMIPLHPERVPHGQEPLVVLTYGKKTVPPGKQYSYINTGFALHGQITEMAGLVVICKYGAPADLADCTDGVVEA